MFRKTAWRKAATDAVSAHQHRALNTTIFILKEYGPTSFLLKEDGESKPYKVCLGDPHTCTCPSFQREKDLCTHICWILMRKFRLQRDHEYCFQCGLVERQILEMLQGLHVAQSKSTDERENVGLACPGPSENDGWTRQKAIGKEDICPICQEDLVLKQLPVTFCKLSCGNNIHISCMKVWADHQHKKDPRGLVKCPLCREVFGTFKELNEQVKNANQLSTCYERNCLNKHLGVVCNVCRVCPVIGNCFKCTECSYFYLCEECYRRREHPMHSFIVRMKRGQPWQRVSGHNSEDSHVMSTSSCRISSVPCDVVPNHVIKSLPVVRVRKESSLLHSGVQCRICLWRFQVGQHVRTLACKHKFHVGCIDPLLRKSNCCPLDWYVIFNPLTWNQRSSKDEGPLAPSGDVQTMRGDTQISDFFLPGIALQVNKVKAPSLLKTKAVQPSLSGTSFPSSVDSLAQGFPELSVNRSHMGPYTRRRTLIHKLSEERSSPQRSLSLGKTKFAPTEKKASLITPNVVNCLSVRSAVSNIEGYLVIQPKSRLM